jgi:uncharacterized membrane protein YgcG
VTRPSTAVRRSGVLACAIAIAALSPLTTSAEEIMRLDGAVTDTADALGGRTAEVEQAIEATLDRGVQVFVLFVRSTDDLTAADYAAQTADRNSLGVDDALILVAMDDRTDYIWVSDSLDEITDDELDTILADTLEPSLRDGEHVEGAIAAVQALGEAAGSPAPTDAPVVPGPITVTPSPGETGDRPGGAVGLGTILAFALVVGGAAVLYWSWRRRQTTPPATSPGVAGTGPALSGPELRQRANALLIATDERIRDARQEVDFAEAQYGSEAVVELRAAVAEAQTELAASFTMRQRLDDDEPESDQQREAMLREIVERTTRAQETLDAETARIRELRDLERDAPATLVELPGQIEAVEDRLPTVRETLDDLKRYAEPAWRPIAGNVEEAEKGLAGARTAVTVASAAMSRGDRSDVAVATREALEGVTGATELLDAIGRLAVTVADAEQRLSSELAEADRDLRGARQALAELGQLDVGMAGRVREVERAIDTAHDAARQRPADPVDALRLATEAHRLADALLIAARDAATARDRLESAAESSIRTAQVELDRTATFIASRRRGVGEAARTRLAEAERHLVGATALVTRDPAAAVEGARRAQQLATEAYQLASSDFSDWDQGGPGWGQRSGTGEGDATAQILGQILGGIIGGAVRSGGGWGGSPWGGPGRSSGGSVPDLGGLGGGWGRGGGFGTGGFGGGGGGGRGRGGRW